MNSENTILSPQILPHGQDGILVCFDRKVTQQAGAAALTLRRDITLADLPGISEVSASLTSVLVRFDPDATTRAVLSKTLGTLLSARDWAQFDTPAPTRRWTIPVTFGGAAGPQLAQSADLAGQSVEQAVSEICNTELRVLTIGYAPGQPYLGMLPDHWGFPRLPELTPAVPAGALVVAVRQLVIFTNASATGWRQIGQTAFRPFLQDRAEPLLFQQGDAVQFTTISHAEWQSLEADNADGLGGAICKVTS